MDEVLGLDLDDVLAPYHARILFWYNARFGTKFTTEDLRDNMLSGLWKRDIPETQRLIEAFHASPEFKEMKPFHYAERAVHRLAKTIRIASITARQYHIQPVTLQWMRQYFPSVNTVCFARNAYVCEGDRPTKAEHCQTQNVGKLVEDNPSYAKDCAETGVKVIIFDQPWNDGLNGQHPRVKDWKEAEEVIMELYRRNRGK